MLLFQSCHFCKGKNPPEVEAQQIGTKAVITTVCTNPGCCAAKYARYETSCWEFSSLHVHPVRWWFNNKNKTDLQPYGFGMCISEHLLQTSKKESSWQQPCNGFHGFSAVHELPCWMWHCNNHLYLRPSHPDCSLLQDSPQTHHTIL
ncbi:unnamed protein product [Porites lobata]|uniref:Uncharacterized protein n=1 Tax=Porites lobata TaxID=104759 RepID=A0ABN8RH83_9CNID|nr:unnamed protein product [Porites lobata]